MDHENDALLKAQEAYDSAKSAHKRIDQMGAEVKDLRNLTEAVVKVNSKVDHISDKVNEIKDDVKKVGNVEPFIKEMDDLKKEIKQVSDRPKMWWDKLVAAIIGAAASGLVAAILATILK